MTRTVLEDSSIILASGSPADLSGFAGEASVERSGSGAIVLAPRFLDFFGFEEVFESALR